jgi:hypothetical protein
MVVACHFWLVGQFTSQMIFLPESTTWLRALHLTGLALRSVIFHVGISAWGDRIVDWPQGYKFMNKA